MRCEGTEACCNAGIIVRTIGGGAGTCRRVACAQAAEYCGEIMGGIVDELDKGSADVARLYEGPGVGADDGAGIAERLAELEERRSEVEALPAEFDEGAPGRQRGGQGAGIAPR